MKQEFKDLTEYAVKSLKNLGAGDAVAVLAEHDSSQVKFANSKIVANKTWESADLTFFLEYKKRLAITTIKELSKQSIADTAKKLIEFAKATEPNRDYKGIAEGPFKYKKVEETFDKKIVMLNEKIIDYIDDAINIANENRIKRIAGIIEKSSGCTYLATSNNVGVEDEGTNIYFSLRAINEKDESGHMVSVSRVLNKFKPADATKFAVDIANQSKKPKEGKEGIFDVLFEPMAFACLLQQAGNAASIFNVEAGISCLSNKLGKVVADKKINFYDDGRLKNGLGSCNSDAEGVPTQKTKIIEEGMLKNYLHNTSTARRYNTNTTANAGLITPQPHNLILKQGDYKKEELFRDIKRGIYITNVWYTRFQNFYTGDFSTIPRDGIFYIENGKIKYPIKGIRISDNLLNILKNTKNLGRDSVQIKSWEVEIPVITPPVLVEGVNITKPL